MNTKKMYKFKPFSFTEIDENSIVKPPEGTPSKLIKESNNNNKNFVYYYLYHDKFRGIWSFNLSSKQWKKLFIDKTNYDDTNKLLPSNYDGDQIIGIIKEENLIKIFSVKSNDTTHFVSCLQIYDTITNKIETIESKTDFEDFLGSSTVIFHDNYYYTCVDTKGPYVFRYDTKTKYWDCIYEASGGDYVPGHTGNFESIFNDGKLIYYFREQENQELWTEVSTFDLEKHRWASLDTIGDFQSPEHFPEQRNAYSLAQYKDPDTNEINIILSGGFVEGNFYNDIWKFNVNSLKWTCLQKLGFVLPSGWDMYLHSTCITRSGQLLTYGGFARDGFFSIENYDTIHSAWIRIPKLMDICWEAVCYYFPEIFSKSEQEIEEKYGLNLELFQSKTQS